MSIDRKITEKGTAPKHSVLILREVIGVNLLQIMRGDCGHHYIMIVHADIRTTMIYTHCIPSRSIKEAKSPLDF